MKRLALALGLIAAPLAAQTTLSPYDQAVAARQRGDAAEAVRLLTPIVAAEPHNADAQVQLGYAYLALDRLDDAQTAFRAALIAAPDYADARVGLAQVARRRGNAVAALAELGPPGSDSEEARTLRSALLADPALHRWSLDLEGSLTAIGQGRSDWSEGAVQLRRRVNAGSTIGARVEVARRFDRTDVYGEASIERALGTRGHGYLTLGGTPNADFRPKWQVGAGGSLRLTEGPAATVATLDLRHAHFASGNIDTVSPGVEQYLAGGKAWLTARMINLFGGGRHQAGFLVRGDAMASNALRLYAGYADAPDTEQGVALDTKSVFGGLSYELQSGTTLRASLSHDDPAGSPGRTQIGLGVGWRF
jgi:YaiO family outer membrane protein